MNENNAAVKIRKESASNLRDHLSMLIAAIKALKDIVPHNKTDGRRISPRYITSREVVIIKDVAKNKNKKLASSISIFPHSQDGNNKASNNKTKYTACETIF